MLTPEMSIVIRAYNAELFIEETILSAVRQNHLTGDHEIIVVNDGSTDRTPAIVTSIQAQLPRDFVRVNSTDNRGEAAAANTGVMSARAGKILFLDSDDLIVPQALYVLSKGLDKHVVASGEKRGFRRGKRGETIFTYSPRSSKKTQLLRPADNPEELYYLHANILGAPRAFRRTDYERVGGSDENMRVADDYDLGLRIIYPGKALPVFVTNRVLFYHRRVGNSQSFRNRTLQSREAETAINRAFSRLGISGLQASAAGRDDTGYLFFAHIPA